MDSSDICFRQCLVERYEKTQPDVAHSQVQYNTQSLDDALQYIHSIHCCQSKDNTRQSKQSNRSRAEHEDIDSAIMNIHENLVGYWNQFGFMNESTPSAFLKLIKNNIVSFKPSTELGDEEIENSDDDES